MRQPKEGTAEKVQKTLDFLIEKEIVPPYKSFDITEEMLSAYVAFYGSLDGGGKRKFDYDFARKIAGMNLLDLKFSRGSKTKDCKEGMVYLIANPAWPDYIKIGMSIDSKNRLASYQTYDPFKAYYIKHYEFTLDRRAAEKKLLDDFQIHLVDGEWVKHSDGWQIIKVLKNY